MYTIIGANEAMVQSTLLLHAHHSMFMKKKSPVKLDIMIVFMQQLKALLTERAYFDRNSWWYDRLQMFISRVRVYLYLKSWVPSPNLATGVVVVEMLKALDVNVITSKCERSNDHCIDYMYMHIYGATDVQLNGKTIPTYHQVHAVHC